MPAFITALLALVVFGAIGTLLAATLIAEQLIRSHAAKRYPPHPGTIAAISRAGKSLHSKPHSIA
jgi:hypothetical protein